MWILHAVLVQVYGGTGVLPRGLTHPTAVPPPASVSPRSRPRERGNAVSRALGTEAGSIGGERPAPRRSDAASGQGNAGLDSGFLTRWGAVPVGPRALVGLLRAGETVMLFPGGATEVRCAQLPSHNPPWPTLSASGLVLIVTGTSESHKLVAHSACCTRLLP